MKYFTGLFALCFANRKEVLETLCQTVRAGYSLGLVVLAKRTSSGFQHMFVFCCAVIENMSLDAVS